MDAEVDQMCEATGNSRNGYGLRTLKTCVGELSLRVPKLRSGSFFPEDVITRYQRGDQALAAAVAEMYVTGTSTHKVQRATERMGVSRLSKDQVSTIARDLFSVNINRPRRRRLGGGRARADRRDAVRRLACWSGARWTRGPGAARRPRAHAQVNSGNPLK